MQRGTARDSAIASVDGAKANFQKGDLAALSRSVDNVVSALGPESTAAASRILAIKTQADLLDLSDNQAAISYLTDAILKTTSPSGRLDLKLYLAEKRLAPLVERGEKEQIEGLRREAVDALVPQASQLGEPDLAATAYLLVADLDYALLKWSQAPGNEYRDALTKALALVTPERDVNRWSQVQHSIGVYEFSSGHYQKAIEDYDIVLKARRGSIAWPILSETYFGQANAYAALGEKLDSRAEAVAALTKSVADNDEAITLYKQNTGVVPMRMAINGADHMATLAVKINDPDGLLKSARAIEDHKDDSNSAIYPMSWSHVQAIIATHYHNAGILLCRARRVTECVAALSKATQYYSRSFSVFKREIAPAFYDELKRQSEENEQTLRIAMNLESGG